MKRKEGFYAEKEKDSGELTSEEKQIKKSKGEIIWSIIILVLSYFILPLAIIITPLCVIFIVYHMIKIKNTKNTLAKKKVVKKTKNE